ncbi:ATP-binding protein [Ideonella sp. 4Y11]|uniref:ATP-binding protein n=1 Tax=Ideonella aquatica TaxID=2824119 RepID=A0A941BE97_9BURK|nr:ATP-binding protein [Ideonella aquatica]MBQ0957491.1 ATP-binding protein [Ideonella aquatica]
MTPDLTALRLSTRRALAAAGLRVADSLRASCDSEPDAAARAHWLAAIDFAHRFAHSLGPHQTLPPAHPLSLLAQVDQPTTATLLTELLLIACLPLAHEGFAALCRPLHPLGGAAPTAQLALQALEHSAPQGSDPMALRDAVEALLLHAPLASLGLVRLAGGGPWQGRELLPGPGVWEALMGHPPKLARASRVAGYTQVPGLQEWLDSGAVQQAVRALARGLPCQILLLGGDATMRATRVRALLGAAGVSAMGLALEGSDATDAAATRGLALLLGDALWLEARHDEPAPEALSPWPLPGPPGSVLASARSERQLPDLGLPQLRLDLQPLPATARRSLWQQLLPQLGEQAGLLAARYPVEPDEARDVVRDLGLRQSLAEAPLPLDEIGACIRARTPFSARPGVQRVAPQAGWDQLLLPDAQRAQLHSAVRRVLQQITVLDDWGFAQGRSERRGVRTLFCGTPGTGKTLAAEVMARALGVEMLVIDLASLVSKWIGETEKNLAAVFDLAERSRALLLFDEADALFAKRTETADAHDRYANLETAYLLQRLERYQGIAVLTTNLRSNLDSAFSRRFEYIVEFPEPDAAARLALWRLHLPSRAPLAADVDLAELADWYAISGAQIKNAALAAAFLAAAAGRTIHQRHFLAAIEREYDKAGRAHPGVPAHHPWPADDAATPTLHRP